MGWELGALVRGRQLVQVVHREVVAKGESW